MAITRKADHATAIGPTELRRWRKHFTDEGWPKPQLYFRYLASSDRWEVWRINGGGNTLVAHRAVDADWVVV